MIPNIWKIFHVVQSTKQMYCITMYVYREKDDESVDLGMGILFSDKALDNLRLEVSENVGTSSSHPLTKLRFCIDKYPAIEGSPIVGILQFEKNIFRLLGCSGQQSNLHCAESSHLASDNPNKKGLDLLVGKRITHQLSKSRHRG